MARHPITVRGLARHGTPPAWGKVMTKESDLYFFPELWNPDRRR